MGYKSYDDILNDNLQKLIVLPTKKITIYLKEHLPITFERSRLTKQDNVNSTIIVVHSDGVDNYFNLNDVYRIVCEKEGE